MVYSLENTWERKLSSSKIILQGVLNQLYKELDDAREDGATESETQASNLARDEYFNFKIDYFTKYIALLNDVLGGRN